ncbi:MAG TPA: histidine kinase dimerization/phospho-acceptor domain-containing protein, partial [Chloroflexota bacterium]
MMTTAQSSRRRLAAMLFALASVHALAVLTSEIEPGTAQFRLGSDPTVGGLLAPGLPPGVLVVAVVAALALGCAALAVGAGTGPALQSDRSVAPAALGRRRLLLGAGGGAAAFVAPPVLMLDTAKHHDDHTTDSARQLRRLNDELVALKDDLARAIRQREATEEENARLAHEAARAAALEELSRLKSRFISAASHGLRTPLTAVVGYADLVLADTDKDDPRYAMLTIVQLAGRELADQFADLVDVLSIEAWQLPVKPTAADLEAALAAVAFPCRVRSGAPAT